MECRFCFQKDLRPLLSPCRCNGTIKYVHTSCLERWRRENINQPSFSQCLICKTNYIGIDIPPPSPPPPVLEISIEQDESVNSYIPAFGFCHCYKLEGGFYIGGIVFFFSSVVLGTGTPRKPDEEAYYMVLVLITMISCFFIGVWGLFLFSK